MPNRLSRIVAWRSRLRACSAFLLIACASPAWPADQPTPDKPGPAAFVVLDRADLGPALAELDFIKQDYANVRQERDLLKQKVEVLTELLALKQQVLALKDEIIAARGAQLGDKDKQIAALAERLDKMEAKLERAGLWGDLKALFVGILAIAAVVL